MLVALIVLGAFVVRLAYLYQIENIPFFYGLVSDAERYDAWARSIAGGDWLGDSTFYQAPLYPYFLAVIKALLGDSPFTTRLVQIMLGSLSCGLIALSGAAFFSRRAGLWAGGILALYPPAIFFDGLVQKTSLAQFLLCLLLVLMGWQLRRARIVHSLAIGMGLGLFCLTRENALALIPVVAAWAWLCRSAEGPTGTRRRLGQTACVLVGLALVLLPVGLRNHFVGGEFVLTTAQMGPNFYIGNNPEATGRYRPLVEGHETPFFEQNDARHLAEQDLDRPLAPAEVSRYWLGRSWTYIRGQPLDWLKLLGVKWMLVWNAYEITDAEGYYVYRDWSWLLGTLGSFLDFGVLAPAAAAGVVLSWRQRRRLWALYGLPLVTALAVALFYVFARYRYPIMP
ncbi:MAG: ArnT family glycosyltransferase, partial [Planctomycetota bacterium]